MRAVSTFTLDPDGNIFAVSMDGDIVKWNFEWTPVISGGDIDISQLYIEKENGELFTASFSGNTIYSGGRVWVPCNDICCYTSK